MDRTAPSPSNRRAPIAAIPADRGVFGLRVLALSMALACGGLVRAEPTGGVVAAGAAAIGGTAAHTVVTQTTPQAVINWQSFGIRAGESVRFVQHRGVRDAHAGQIRDHLLEVQNGFQAALRNLRLVRRVGRVRAGFSKMLRSTTPGVNVL